MKPLRGIQGYIDNPGKPESYARAGVNFKNPQMTVISFGFGNSFFDGVTMLEQELGFRGRYILVESQPRAPWVITREEEIPDDVYYKFGHFVPSKLPCPLTFETLNAALQKDIDDLSPVESNPLRYGIEHPLYYVAAFAMQYFQAWEGHHRPDETSRAKALEAFTALQKRTAHQLKDVISPQALDLYNKAVAAGRVEIVKGRVLPAHVHYGTRSLVVPVALQEGGIGIVHGDALLNGMPQQGDWRQIKDGLLPRMGEKGLIHLHKTGAIGLYDFDHALKQGIGLTGASVDSIWGVHILANKAGIAANELIRQMTGFN